MKLSLPRCSAIVFHLVAGLLLALNLESRGAVVPKGTRLLGIDVNATQDGNFVDSFATAKSVGMQVISLVVYWDEIETAPGIYAPSPNWLWIANYYYPLNDTQVLLSVVPVDTLIRRMPADLEGRRLDDPVVIDRFRRFLDYVFSQIPQMQLTAFSIGNESDIHLGTDPDAWAQFRTFFAASAEYARSLRPGLKVGVQMTHDSAVAATTSGFVSGVNQLSDVLLISYHPLWSNFTVKPTSVVRADWDTLLRLHPERPVMFSQLGYPSSTVNASSQSRQKTYIDNVFATWDDYASRVPLVLFVRLNDADASVVAGWSQYYGISDTRFTSFLATLGLRTATGVSKSAFTALKQHTLARGW